MKLKIAFFALFLFSCLDGKKELQQIKQQELKPEPPPVTRIEADYCPVEDSQTIAETLVIFAMDYSGSNYNRVMWTDMSHGCFEGTDPVNKRFEEIISFIDAQQESDNNIISYSIMPWGTDILPSCYNVFDNQGNYDPYNGTKSYSNKAGEVKKFAKALVKIKNEDFEDDEDIEAFELDPECEGWTNYVDTIQHMSQTKTRYLNDLRGKYSKNNPQYENSEVIVFTVANFVSDGEPRMPLESPGPDGRMSALQNSNIIYQKVLDYMNIHNVNLSNTRISRVIPTFNTSFYTTHNELVNNDPRCQGQSVPDEQIPITLLQNMAYLGSGGYYDIRDNPDYRNFRMPTIFNRYETQQAFAINRNAVWERNENGVLGYYYDTDKDGISDEKERRLDSDPYNADSNGNGISDGVMLLIRPNQSPRVPYAFNPIGGCSAKQETNINGLSDCDELALGMDPSISDESKDGIPDGILVRAGVNITSSNHSSDVDGDGYTNLDEIRFNFPVRHHNRDLPEGTKKQLYTVKSLPDDLYDKSSCKRMIIDDFRVADYEKEFEVEVYFYSLQEYGKIKMLNRARKTAMPGDFIRFHPDDFTETYFEQSE